MTKHRDPNHIHKLLLHRYKNGKSTYFCVNDCDYKISPELSLGKTVECWRCGNTFRMNSYSLTLKKPHCEDCHVRKKDGEKRSKLERRRVSERRDLSTQPSTAIVNELASSSIDDLKSRLKNLSGEPIIIDEDL